MRETEAQLESPFFAVSNCGIIGVGPRELLYVTSRRGNYRSERECVLLWGTDADEQGAGKELRWRKVFPAIKAASDSARQAGRHWFRTETVQAVLEAVGSGLKNPSAVHTGML